MSCKGKNAYLVKQKAVQQAYMLATERVTRQLMADCMMKVLNEEFGFGYDRIKRMMDVLSETYNDYHEALDGGPEADYLQEKLDEAMRRIIKGRELFHPFSERYPEIKTITYTKK